MQFEQRYTSISTKSRELNQSPMIFLPDDHCNLDVLSGEKVNPQRCFIYFYGAWKVDKEVRWLIYRPPGMKGLILLCVMLQTWIQQNFDTTWLGYSGIPPFRCQSGT